MIFCISNLNTEVDTEPFEYLNLSSLEMLFRPASLGKLGSEFFFFKSLIQNFAAARPKTTKSRREFDPSLLAP